MVNKVGIYNTGESLLDLEAKYKASKNVLYAVVAIGESPEAPPAWALQVCKLYRRGVEVAHVDKLLTHDVTPTTTNDDDLLDHIARCFITSGTSKTHMSLRKGDGYLDAAIVNALPENDAESRIDTLRRRWNAEQLPGKVHHRLDRIGYQLIAELEGKLKK